MHGHPGPGLVRTQPWYTSPMLGFSPCVTGGQSLPFSEPRLPWSPLPKPADGAAAHPARTELKQALGWGRPLSLVAPALMVSSLPSPRVTSGSCRSLSPMVSTAVLTSASGWKVAAFSATRCRPFPPAPQPLALSLRPALWPQTLAAAPPEPSLPQAFFCGRSDYFRALLDDHFRENEELEASGGLPAITLHGISPDIFTHVLYYIYSDHTEVRGSGGLRLLGLGA